MYKENSDEIAIEIAIEIEMKTKRRIEGHSMMIEIEIAFEIETEIEIELPSIRKIVGPVQVHIAVHRDNGHWNTDQDALVMEWSDSLDSLDWHSTAAGNSEKSLDYGSDWLLSWTRRPVVMTVMAAMAVMAVMDRQQEYGFEESNEPHSTMEMQPNHLSLHFDSVVAAAADQSSVRFDLTEAADLWPDYCGCDLFAIDCGS